MRKITLYQYAKRFGITYGDKDVEIIGISTDSRTLQAGEIFLALCGNKIDGHNFVHEAEKKGAAAIIASTPIICDKPVLYVQDTQIAYGQLALMHRELFDLPIVAITGSCGKTTTKYMLASIFNYVYAENFLYSKLSYNNEIGVPYTLMQLNSQHQAAIIEMGARFPQDIEYLSNITKQTMAIITNAAAVHLDTLVDVEGVAKTKAAIYKNLPINGVAIINIEDAFAPYWISCLQGQKIITVGLNSHADVYATDISRGPQVSFRLHIGIESHKVTLPSITMHDVMNALLAAASAYQQNISLSSIVAGLQTYKLPSRRMQLLTTRSGAKIIDDSYNANPLAMQDAIKALSACQGKKILVVGDMLELGENQESMHRQIGFFAKYTKIDKLLAFGDLSYYIAAEFGDNAKHYQDLNNLIIDLKSMLDSTTTVLIKASNSMNFDVITQAITKETCLSC